MFLELSKGLSATDAVIMQMETDYPKSSLKWMQDYDWDWPHAVPLDEIDTSNKKKWKARGSDNKVEKFKAKITQGVMKPVVLVRPEGSALYVVVDGHHRVLSCMGLDRPVLAWTTKVDKKKGPWDYLHDAQSHSLKKKVKLSVNNLDRVCLAADSMAKASTPEPFSKNPLWHKKDPSFHLPYYVQHVAHELVKQGKSESEAIEIAIGIIKNWAAGRPSGGEKKVHPDTRAAAQKALSEWNSLKARAKGSK